MNNLWSGRRTEWLILQFFVGVTNAYFVIDGAVKSNWWVFCGSVLAIIITSQWKLPSPIIKGETRDN